MFKKRFSNWEMGNKWVRVGILDSWEGEGLKQKFWVFSLFCLMMSFCVLFGILFMQISLVGSGYCYVVNINLMSSTALEVSFPLVFDWISLSFGSTVCFISSWVMIYSRFYMGDEKFLLRFLLLVSLFVLSMNLLIFSPSMMTLMIGWDGLGVVSFLLVVYYSNSESYAAGMITVFSNRIGDIFFIIFIGFACCGLDFEPYGMMIYMKEEMFFLGICILLGSITKSAQLPFCAWLPAAMAAPTPVSTLVHSSTLVTAGVYMIIRFGFLMSESMKMLLFFLSIITFYLAAISGVYEVDLKKVVALSTLSQVSMMMMALGIGISSLALFHLLVHAFFKALMFMCVGSVIACSGGVQDIRFLSGFWKKLPVSMAWFCVSVACLSGLPFLSGFYSKDLIIEKLVTSYVGLGVYALCLLSISLTAWYSLRSLSLLFKNADMLYINISKEDSLFLMSALTGLGMGGFAGGAVLQSLLLDGMMFVQVTLGHKVVIFMCLIAGPLLMLYYFKNKDYNSYYESFSKGDYYKFGPCSRYRMKMNFLPILTGNWISFIFLKYSCFVVKAIESFWVNKIFWGLGFGLVFRFSGGKVRNWAGSTLAKLLFSLVMMSVLLLFLGNYAS